MLKEKKKKHPKLPSHIWHGHTGLAGSNSAKHSKNLFKHAI